MKCKNCDVSKCKSNIYMLESRKEYMGWCYSCVHKDKLKIQKIKRNCKICNETLSKSRWKYCSPECAEKGMARLQKDKWFKKVQVKDKINWKNY